VLGREVRGPALVCAVCKAPATEMRSIPGLPAIPPISVTLLPSKACWNCGAPAAVSIRVLAARHHRFYCHAGAKVVRHA
jgi:hypothetical protein